MLGNVFQRYTTSD